MATFCSTDHVLWLFEKDLCSIAKKQLKRVKYWVTQLLLSYGICYIHNYSILMRELKCFMILPALPNSLKVSHETILFLQKCENFSTVWRVRPNFEIIWFWGTVLPSLWEMKFRNQEIITSSDGLVSRLISLQRESVSRIYNVIIVISGL